MKVAPLCAMLVMAILGLSGFVGAKTETEDKTITKIVKALEKMLEDIGAEGEAERVEFAKMKCYCDTNTDEKTASIAKLTEQIAKLGSEIDFLMSENGKLSIEAAKLQTMMDANRAAVAQAAGVRSTSKAAFEETETELVAALAQMTEAISVLTAVGADQSLAVGADHTQFQAGYKGTSLVKLQAKVSTALRAASGLLEPKQRQAVESLLQAPFTGTYTSQSAAVIGILKQLKTTFTENLASARTAEANEKAAFSEFTTTKQSEWDTMDASKTAKEGKMGTNEQDLSTKKEALGIAESTKADDEAFLEKLTALCTKKTKQYDQRKMMRANERAALAEAIAILNSDLAFANFGKVKATSEGATGLVQKRVSFLQLGSGRTHGVSARQQQAQELLRHKSARLAVIAKELGGATPFDALLTEIDKMLAIIATEGSNDKENLDFCNQERTDQDAALVIRNANILKAEGDINEADTAINDPTTGLLVQISGLEDDIKENQKAQADETKTRADENKIFVAYKAEMDQAEETLKSAIAVLKKYYADLAEYNAGVSLAQKRRADPVDKTSFGYEYADKGGRGASVISMLEFVLDETEKEETTAKNTEDAALLAYTEEMERLKGLEEDMESSLVTTKETLAQTQKELLEAKQDLKDETAAKEAIEAYLLKIKPGCDFITANFDLREANRADEKAALQKVIGFIKASPAYLSATTLMKVKSWGKCQDTCTAEGENHVKCKACLAETSVPGYCAGHKGEAGLIGC
mmetsp:Transcript_997/g.1727  ORF Transcript_997/g.1727 Transcript_997/m.1727 type:complete len:754 (+) Transcript_997:78-2339(+)